MILMHECSLASLKTELTVILVSIGRLMYLRKSVSSDEASLHSSIKNGETISSKLISLTIAAKKRKIDSAIIFIFALT